MRPRTGRCGTSTLAAQTTPGRSNPETRPSRPTLGNQAVAAGASDVPFLGWAADRGGDETRIDVESRVEDVEAVGHRADLGEVAPHGSRIGEEKGAVGANLRAETEDGELRHEPLGFLDCGAGFLADRELRWQGSLGQLTAGTAAKAAGAVGLADLAAVALRPIRAREGRPKGPSERHALSDIQHQTRAQRWV